MLNLEVYWRRRGAELWFARAETEGHQFPKPLKVGDILTWRVSQPHVGIVSGTGLFTMITHNIGGGTLEVPLITMLPYRASGHYRWPGGSA